MHSSAVLKNGDFIKRLDNRASWLDIGGCDNELI